MTRAFHVARLLIIGKYSLSFQVRPLFADHFGAVTLTFCSLVTLGLGVALSTSLGLMPSPWLDTGFGEPFGFKYWWTPQSPTHMIIAVSALTLISTVPK